MRTDKSFRTLCALALLALAAPVVSCSQAEKKDGPAPAGTAAAADFRVEYGYDASLPLNAEVKAIKEGAPFSIYDVHFDSANGERVPASLYIPSAKKPPYPAIVVQHGYGGDRSFGAPFAGILAPKGYALIAIDAEYHGGRKEPGKDIFSTDALDDRRALLQTVIDLRRAVDYLASRGDIDMSRIGYTGASMGGMLGGLFTGVEDRVKTAVLIVGGGGWEVMVSTSKVPCFEDIRKFVKEKGMTVEQFVAPWDAVDPVNLAGHISPRPLLMLNCENDKYVPKAAGEALFAAAAEPKDIRWFTCDGDIAHIPPTDKTMEFMTKWFRKFL